jgi:hypothetical protein
VLFDIGSQLGHRDHAVMIDVDVGRSGQRIKQDLRERILDEDWS